MRRWRNTDIVPFADLNANQLVMEFFVDTLSTEQTITMVQKIEEEFENKSFGLWAAELKSTGKFIGFVGLHEPKFEAHFMPCVEIGWRLAREYWGKGLALEAAKEVIKDGFARLDLAEIVSFTASINTRSIRVMERLGMKKNPQDDFLHPSITDGHILSPHVLYRLSKGDLHSI